MHVLATLPREGRRTRRKTLAASNALATPKPATEPSILESDIGSNEEETKCTE
jgi:hypothetical protein